MNMSHHMRLFALMFGCVAAWSIASAQDFQCAPLLPSASQLPGYSRISGQQRCEGFFRQSVSQPFVELVSVTRNASRLTENIALAWIAASSARILIQPLRASPFYRIDAALVAGHPFEWNPQPMLSATGLLPTDLGFLAVVSPSRAQGADLLQVVPLSLPSTGREGVFVTIRPSVALSALHWREYLPDQPGGDWRSFDGPAPFAWQPIPLALSSLVAQQKGVRVDIRTSDRKGRSLPMLSFVVLP